MGRPSTFEKGLKKGPWTSEEDRKLVTYVEEHGHGSWRSLPIKAGLQRCGKSCRLRWTNYLRPDIIRGKFSLQEEETIIQLHALLGNRWSAIATHLPKRTDNEIKNFWNTNLKKRLTKTGIDPITHKSKTTVDTNLRHMTQWENARLEAEARFVRESRLVSNFYRRIHCHSPPLIKNLQAVSSSSLPQTVCLDVLKAWQGIISCKLSDEAPNDQITMPPMVNLDHENVSKSSYMAPTESPLQVSDMKYQDDYLTEAFTNHTVYDANNESFCGDFEDDDKGYWSRMLDKLENNSSFPSIF